MSENQGFMVGGRREDLFKGTAAYYDAYRRPYPQAVVDHIARRCRLDGRGRLLDAGCGTGQVFQAMAKYFTEVLAIDPDADMLKFARKRVNKLKMNNVLLRQMRAEELTDSVGPLRAAIFGASFHWTDRVAVAENLYDLLECGGQLLVLSPSGIHSGKTVWEVAIQETLVQYFGLERQAGSGSYVEGERHEQALERTRFGNIEVVDIPVYERWSIDQLVGYLFSTSYASKSLLGKQAHDFEQTARQRLLSIQPDGCFEKTIEYTVILAER